MEDAAAASKLALEPICPVCTEPWTCSGDHRICCIPCGHVYGRSCLERWLPRCGVDSAKCPQCGEQFEDKLIINLYAPGNLWDSCCRLQAQIVQRRDDWNRLLQYHSQMCDEHNVANAAFEKYQRVHLAAMIEFITDSIPMPKMGPFPSLPPPYPKMPTMEEFLATTEIEDAAPRWGDEAVAPKPICPVCMEPWTCNGDHCICCIPCGHVYGRSCLERWLHRCGGDSANVPCINFCPYFTCPQCGEQFEDKLIINLYAPGNLRDSGCRLQAQIAQTEDALNRLQQYYSEMCQEYHVANAALKEYQMTQMVVITKFCTHGTPLPEQMVPPSLPPFPNMPTWEEFSALHKTSFLCTH